MGLRKQKTQKDWQDKVVVDSTSFHVISKPPISHQIDKQKGLRRGQPQKKGFLLPKKVVAESPLEMTANIEDAPVSMRLAEKWDGGPGAKVANKNPNRFLRIADAQSRMDFVTHLPILEAKTRVYKPPNPSPFE